MTICMKVEMWSHTAALQHSAQGRAPWPVQRPLSTCLRYNDLLVASLHTGILIIIDKYHLKCLKQVLFDSKAFKIKFCEAHAKDQALIC